MITNSMMWIILVGAFGLPSAIVGILTNRIIKKIDKVESERQEKENKRIKHETMMIELAMASLELAEVTAEAVQRIPDSNCNGDMSHALGVAKEIREKYRKFEHEQTVKSIA